MVCKKDTETSTASGTHREKDKEGSRLVMLATCFGLLCGIGILFGIVGLLLKFGGKVLGACATILLPIGVIWLGFKIVFAVVPLLFKLVCAALICYLVYRILREMKLVA